MKKLALLALLLVSAATYAAAPIIWDDADFGKLLVNKGIRFKDGVQILEGVATPTVTAVNAPRGSLFLRTSVTGGALFVKQDAGLTTNWAQTSGTNTGNVFVTVPANGLSVDSATQVMTLVTATASSTGSLSLVDWLRFDSASNKVVTATALATPNTLVLRDVNGDFEVQSITVTALSSGAVTSNSNGTLASVPMTDGQFLIGFTGSAPVASTITAGTGVTILNGPGSVTISAPASALALNQANIYVGNGANLATQVTVTGDAIMNAAGALTVTANAITNSKLAQMPANTFKANSTAALADAQDITTVTATAMLPAFIGDSGAGGVKGLVPAPATGDAAASKFLSANGLWTAVTTTASTAVGGDIVFQQSGGTSVGDDIGNPYVFSAGVSVTAVKVGMFNGGTSGNTTFTVKQYRAGVLFNSGIGIVASNGGLVYGGSITLSPGPLQFIANDVATVDINSVALGTPQDFSLIMSSGNTGATGATGSFGAGLLVTKSADYTSVNTDNYIICNAATGSFTITLETAVGNSGVSHVIKRSDSSASIVTVAANGAQTIDGDLTYQLTDPKTSVTIVSDGSNWHVTAIQ